MPENVVHSDSLMKGLKCLVDVRSRLKLGSRSQLNMPELIAVKMYCSQSIANLSKERVPDAFKSTATLSNVVELIDTVLARPAFMETANEEKEFIISSIMTSVDELMLIVGKYYSTEHSFTLNLDMFNFYKEIVDTCVRKGFYFGLDREV